MAFEWRRNRAYPPMRMSTTDTEATMIVVTWSVAVHSWWEEGEPVEEEEEDNQGMEEEEEEEEKENAIVQGAFCW
jgi:hypothetical protein